VHPVGKLTTLWCQGVLLLLAMIPRVAQELVLAMTAGYAIHWKLELSE
jgi:hypothetical protein